MGFGLSGSGVDSLEPVALGDGNAACIQVFDREDAVYTVGQLHVLPLVR